MTDIGRPIIDSDESHEHDGSCVHAAIAEHEKAGIVELQELLAAGFSYDDIETHAVDNENLRLALEIAYIGEDVTGWTTELGHPIARNIREIIGKNKSSLIGSTTRQLAQQVVDYLPEAPTANALQAIVLSMATGVVINTRVLKKTQEAKLESSLINQFTAELISRVSLDNICGSYTNLGTVKHDEDNPFVAMALAAAKLFNESYPQFEPVDYKFLLNKLNYLAMELKSAAIVNRFINEFTDSPEEGGEIKLRETSDEMARQIGRIRSYEIKPMLFELGDEGAGHQAVYREPRDFMADVGLENQFDPQNSLANITIPLAENQNPTELKVFQYVGIEGNKMSRIALEGTNSTYVVTRTGEIRSGVTLLNGTMDLRTMFERQGKGAHYETLRAKILGQIFDATAPATIIEQIQLDDAPVAQLENEHDTIGEKGGIVYDMLVRRIRYVKRPMRQIKQEFDAALAQEAETTERAHRYLRQHDVTGHLRKIPSNASPSEAAIANSKESFGPDYELPEGYTFVKRHERGNIAVGRVIGHTAVHINVTLVSQ